MTDNPPTTEPELAERVGDALERAWNADCAEAEGLPPISFPGSERDYLARAALSALPSREAMLKAERERCADVAGRKSAMLPNQNDFTRGYANGRHDAAQAIRSLPPVDGGEGL